MADYYIDGAVGNDSNAGTSEGSGNAWLTIGKAVSNPIASGDRVFVKASATYTEAPDFSSINGVIANPIVLEGYTSSVGDGGRAVIVHNGAATTTLKLGSFYSVRNFKVTGGANTGIGNSSAGSQIVENCEVDGSVNGTDRGINLGTHGYTVGCYVHDCDTDGIRFFGVGGAFACIADTCVTGITNNTDTYGYFYCIARGNTATGMVLSSNSFSSPMINCTVDALTPGSATGYKLGQGNDVAVAINCVAINCFLGFDMAAPADTQYNFSYNNCVFGNTSDYSAAGNTVAGEITTDPTFVDEAAKDYGPDTGSPLIAAGYDARTNVWLVMSGDAIDVGALQSLGGGSNAAGAFFRWGMN